MRDGRRGWVAAGLAALVACGPAAPRPESPARTHARRARTPGDPLAPPGADVFPSLDVARTELAPVVRDGLDAAEEAFALPPPTGSPTMSSDELGRWITHDLRAFITRKRGGVNAARGLLHLGRTLSPRDRIVAAAWSGVLGEDLLRLGRFVPAPNAEVREALERGFVRGVLHDGSAAAETALNDLQLCATLALNGPAAMRPWGTFCEARRSRLADFLGLNHPDETVCAPPTPADPTGGPRQTLVALDPTFGTALAADVRERVRDAEQARLSREAGITLVPLDRARAAEATQRDAHAPDGRHACAARPVLADLLQLPTPYAVDVLAGDCWSGPQCVLHAVRVSTDAPVVARSAPVTADPLDAASWVSAVDRLAPDEQGTTAVQDALATMQAPPAPTDPPRETHLRGRGFGPWTAPTDVEAALAPRDAAVGRCAASADRHATVEVVLVVGRDGRPTRHSVDTSFGDQAAGDCVWRALDGVRFPAVHASAERRALVHVELANLEHKARSTLDVCAMRATAPDLVHVTAGLRRTETQTAVALCMDAYAPTGRPDDTVYLWTSVDVGADGHVTTATVLPIVEQLDAPRDPAALDTLVHCVRDALAASAWPCPPDGPTHVSATLWLHGPPRTP